MASSLSLSPFLELLGQQSQAVQFVFTLGVVTSLAQGIFLVLAMMAGYSMLHQGLGESKARRFLFAAITVLFLSSSLMFSMGMAMFVKIMTATIEVMIDGRIPNLLLVSQLSTAQVVCSRVNFIVSDIIVIWRAWIIADNLWLRIGLSVCLFMTVVGALLEGYLSSWVMGAIAPGSLGLLLFVPVLMTNVLSTSIIAHKTWIYRRNVKIHFEYQDGRSKVEKVLVLLLESGFIYALFWMFNLILALTIGVRALNASIKSTTPELSLYFVFSTALPYISAIYPIAIILLVAHGKTQDLSSFTNAPRQSIHFASASRRSYPVAGSLSVIADHIYLNRSRSDEESDSPTAELELRRETTSQPKESATAEKSVVAV